MSPAQRPRIAEWLSHPLRGDTPAYGGRDGLSLTPRTRIAAGDTANTAHLSMPVHLGTHVDAPAHFFEQGPDLLSYGPPSWIFDNPVLVEAPCELRLIGPSDLAPAVPEEADLVLLRTGHETRRATPDYWKRGPGLSPELGVWLREKRPNVRAVGMDLISVTSRLEREAGKRAHRAFLDPDAYGEPILLIEDMRLAQLAAAPDWVLVSPLLLDACDGAPVTVWGFRAES